MRFDAQAAVAFEQSQEPLIPKAYQVRQQGLRPEHFRRSL